MDLRAVPNPLVYEINTWPWLEPRSAASNAGRSISAPCRNTEWDRIADLGFDAVWLMGVWRAQPGRNGDRTAQARAGRRLHSAPCRTGAPAMSSVRRTACTTMWSMITSVDRPGSPPPARRSPSAGMRLIIDFVPNHVAPDHPWTTSRPELFVTGTDDERRPGPDVVHQRVGDRVLANGHDPYFPAWPDVVQLNAFHPICAQP